MAAKLEKTSTPGVCNTAPTLATAILWRRFPRRDTVLHETAGRKGVAGGVSKVSAGHTPADATAVSEIEGIST
jgi:hypothetical protein